MKFAKGHGTQNDFVLLLDMPAGVDLAPAAVSALCDRRQGLGADGVLRVTVAGSAREAGVFDALPEGVTADDWFMDYRNADGSVAEMCGNGVRVFAHYLWCAGLERRREFVVGSRAGARPTGWVPGSPRSAAGGWRGWPSTSATPTWPAWIRP